MATSRVEAKAQYDAFLAVCPSHKLLERISGKWVALILTALGSGPDCAGDPRPMRYSELSRLLAGVSQKMLTQTLRSLEHDGLVTRSVVATVPVTVSYELTDLGLSLQQLTRRLRAWAQTHMGDVLEHREAHEAATR